MNDLNGYDIFSSEMEELLKSTQYNNIIFDELFSTITSILFVLRNAIRIIPAVNSNGFKETIPTICSSLQKQNIAVNAFGHFIFCTKHVSKDITISLDIRNMCHLVTPVGSFLCPNISLNTDRLAEIVADERSSMFEFIMWVAATICHIQIYAESKKPLEQFRWSYHITHVHNLDGPDNLPRPFRSLPESIKQNNHIIKIAQKGANSNAPYIYPMVFQHPTNSKGNIDQILDIYNCFMLNRTSESATLFVRWVFRHPHAKSMVLGALQQTTNSHPIAISMMKLVLCILAYRCKDSANIFNWRRTVLQGPVIGYITTYNREVFLKEWSNEIDTREYSKKDMICFMYISGALNDKPLQTVVGESLKRRKMTLPINSIFIQMCIHLKTLSPLYFAVTHFMDHLTLGGINTTDINTRDILYYYEAKRIMQIGHVPMTSETIEKWLPANNTHQPYNLPYPCCAAMDALVSMHPSFPFPVLSVFWDKQFRTVINSAIVTNMQYDGFFKDDRSFFHIAHIRRLCISCVEKFTNNNIIGLSVSLLVTEALIYPFMHDRNMIHMEQNQNTFLYYLQIILFFLELKKQNTFVLNQPTLFNQPVKTESH